MVIRIPKHIAIIMDGNGRWAKERGHPRLFGHIRGAKRVKEVIREADCLGVKALTLFAFSTENWERPASELNLLWKLLKRYLLREVAELHEKNICLRIMGEVERLGSDIRDVIEKTTSKLANNTGLQMTIAVSYGSRSELVRATKLFAQDCISGRRAPSDINEELMNSYLWTAPLGELSAVDLVIRTSGEKRISNYLLWQAAYAEFIFMNLFWPDFEPRHLRQAIEEYSSRERRFGRTADQLVRGLSA